MLTPKRVRELVDDDRLSDAEAEALRDACRRWAEFAWEAWKELGWPTVEELEQREISRGADELESVL